MQTLRRLLLVFPVIVSMGTVLAVAQTVIATVPVGTLPNGIVVNEATNKVYVMNQGNSEHTVTVIDGATDATTTVDVGNFPTAIAINAVTNKIYVLTEPIGQGAALAIIDGATLSVATIAFSESELISIAVNPVTNKIYVGDLQNNDVIVIDGQTLSTTRIAVGTIPSRMAVNSVTDKIYAAFSNVVIVIDGATNRFMTVPIAAFGNPLYPVVNPVTNKIYVATVLENNCMSDDTVTVIDGATNFTTAVPVPCLGYIAVDPVTNKIYVPSFTGTLTVIDGETLSTHTLSLSAGGLAGAVDRVTNKIYVASYPNTVTMIDGVTLATTNVTVGNLTGGGYPFAINESTNRVYVANGADNTVSVIAGGGSLTPLRFIPITPCREVDTRNGNGGILAANTSRNFAMQGACGIPATALAYALNVTVVPPGSLGFVTVWPTGLDQPVSSTLNSLDGRVKANAAIVPGGYNGEVSVFANNATQVILDINGYFVAATDPDGLQFYPMTPCRVVDTRNGTGPLAGPGLTANVARDFPILTSTCNIPNTARAYSLNFTAVPPAPLGFITAWPSDQPRPTTSILNDLTGTVVANAAIVPGASDGDISVYANNNTQLVIDIDGYFAPPANGGLSFYPAQPCRVLDTRKSGGQFNGQLTVNVAGSPCVPPTTAQAYVLNATVVPPGPMGFLTLWANGETRPTASTLNALDGAITSNMAIVPTTNGKIDAFANNPTQLILDLAGYFAP